MSTGRFIAYYRVSTATQGRSGLGVEAQPAAVRAFLNGGDWKLLGEFTEVESGANNARPELGKALNTCRLKGATLVIAKLDRLSRDAHFLLGLDKAGVDFVAADMPSANRMTVGIMAVVAEEERRMIAARTKAALAAAKARGTPCKPSKATRHGKRATPMLSRESCGSSWAFPRSSFRFRTGSHFITRPAVKSIWRCASTKIWCV